MGVKVISEQEVIREAAEVLLKHIWSRKKQLVSGPYGNQAAEITWLFESNCLPERV
jgi:uncharacterized linocin/CFP29 family protein